MKTVHLMNEGKGEGVDRTIKSKCLFFYFVSVVLFPGLLFV